MSARESLWRRRLELEHRSGVLRDRMAEHALALQPAFTAADRVRAVGAWASRHPWVPALLAGLWLAKRPRKVLGWGWRLAKGGLWVWRITRSRKVF